MDGGGQTLYGTKQPGALKESNQEDTGAKFHLKVKATHKHMKTARLSHRSCGVCLRSYASQCVCKAENLPK